jgi:UDP-glucose 4-epimerase
LKYNINKIVFSSTCAVYGTAKTVPIDETHPTNPDNPYGQSKRMIEQMMEWYSKLNGLNFVILRYFNVCGASDDGFIGDSKKPSMLLMQNAVRGAMGIEPFHLTCADSETPDRTPIRDYVNVVDLNEAHLKAIEYLLNGGKSEIINIGTGAGSSVLEIVNKVQEITGKKFELSKAEARKGESPRLVASIEKAKKVLGWQPKRTIEDGVKSLITWYTAHPHGWDH